MGHEITYDWTANDPTPDDGQDLDEYLEDCAVADMDGVLDADIMVLLMHPKLAGGFVELGLALGWNIPVIVLDRHLNQCVFLRIPGIKFAKDEGQVLEWLGAADGQALVDMADESRVNGERLALSGNPEFLRGEL